MLKLYSFLIFFIMTCCPTYLYTSVKRAISPIIVSIKNNGNWDETKQINAVNSILSDISQTLAWYQAKKCPITLEIKTKTVQRGQGDTIEIKILTGSQLLSHERYKLKNHSTSLVARHK